MSHCLRRAAVSLLVIAAITGASACDWRGVNSLPLPGTEGKGPNSFLIQAQMPDVNNIQPNSRVRLADVTVGHVTKVQRQGWHALVTMRLNGDVDLPANTTVKIGTTSLLGSLHIELAPQRGAPPRGKLTAGSVISLENAGSYPSTEQTLAAVSLVLNGGGVGQLQDIVEAFTTAFHGRGNELRSLIEQMSMFAKNLSGQTGDIIAATDSLNNLVGKFAAQRPVLDRAVQTIPDALAVLNAQRDSLVEAADQLGKFSALTVDTVDQTKQNLVNEFRQLGPVLGALADAGPAMTRALSEITTFPFPKEEIPKWQRGDYANLQGIIDLTLSRFDAGWFTGSKWECDLTELELQWGRTIGQLPSPCTSGGPHNPGNPLVVPYHWDQGR